MDSARTDPPADPPPRRSRMDIFVLALLVLAVAAIVVGVRLNADEPSADTGEPPPAGPPQKPPHIETLADMCVNPQPWPGTAAYRGPGPHPFVLFESGFNRTSWEFKDFAPGWEATTVADTRLVVCVNLDASDGIGTCRFDHPEEIKAPVFAATYKFRV